MASRPVDIEELRAAALEPPAVLVDQEAGRVLVRDRGETFGYQLELRPGNGRAGGVGWVEHARTDDGRLETTAVAAAEVMAIARDAGREQQVARATEFLARAFEAAALEARRDGEGSGERAARRAAERLREEVAAGHAFERVSLRALQARLRERLVAGESWVQMSERAGFHRRGGQADTTWLQRRAGLRPAYCGHSQRWRRARTASYELFCQLVQAVDATPEELGV
jgi:hypothetical protein